MRRTPYPFSRYHAISRRSLFVSCRHVLFFSHTPILSFFVADCPNSKENLGSRENQFETAAKLITTRPDTKRATITLYDMSDLERIDSCDIPCTTSITFMPRGNILHMTVCMRANDVVKLMPYNIFEFSLLQECMAARVGMEAGSYWHTAVSAHLRGTNFDFIPSFVAESHLSRRMETIQSFSETERKLLVGEEQRIRECADSLSAMQHLLQKIWDEFSPVWADILSTLACEALYMRTGKSSSIEREIERIMSQHESQCVLLASYRDFLSLREEQAQHHANIQSPE